MRGLLGRGWSANLDCDTGVVACAEGVGSWRHGDPAPLVRCYGYYIVFLPEGCY